MTRRALMFGLFTAVVAGGPFAHAGWGRKKGERRHRFFHLPAPVDEANDDRVKNGRPPDYDNSGYQGYNLGAFDSRSVNSRDPNAPATTGFLLFRFPLRRR